MKAVIQEKYGRAEDLRLADVPLPEPGRNQIRVKVLACAVNLSDWEYLIGKPFYARMVGGLLRPRVPTLGSDIVGLVDKLGAGVTGFRTGQRVMGDYVMTRGGFAEYACVPAAETAVVPEELTDEVAACLPQAGGIAVAGTSNLEPGERLLINGAGGGSGTMALQLAKAADAHVTAVDNEGKLAWLKSLGADEVLDYRKDDFAEIGRKWDRILDMVATRRPGKIARALTRNGVYQALGGPVPILLSLALGGCLWRKSCRIGMLLVPSGRALTERVAKLVADGDLAPHLEAVLPLSAVPEALTRTGQGDVLGKIVIRP